MLRTSYRQQKLVSLSFAIVAAVAAAAAAGFAPVAAAPARLLTAQW